jgi:hypothetical protein
MIHYHGLPITPDSACIQIMHGGHALISHHYPSQLGIAAEVCKSFVLDNGAFSAWKKGEPITDWKPYLEWALNGMSHPNCDWIIIPDVIGGTEKENDSLMDWFVGRWICHRKLPYSECVPVWHLHESFTRLQMLASLFPRIAFGSSGDFSMPKTSKWWSRVVSALRHISLSDGRLYCKVHGLRMLDPAVFTKLPLSSADSTAVGRSIGLDSKWTGSYQPPTKTARGLLMRQRIEHHNSSASIPDLNFEVQSELLF